MPSLVDYYKARSILGRYGIRSARSEYIPSEDAAVSFWNKRGKIVLKALSGRALHKSRLGLVALDLGSEDEIRSAYKMLSKRAARFKPYKIIAQQMIPNGIEIIVGGNVDPQFGRMVLVGLGGIYVETFKDFALAVCPIDRHEALRMINGLRSKSVVAPDKKSMDALAGLVVKVSKMFGNGNFSELDLNPVILHDGTYDAVDLRMLR